MRSVSLFAVAVLAVLMVASMFSPVAALGYLTIVKVTTNGDKTTYFHLTVSGPFSGSPAEWYIPSGDGGTFQDATGGIYTVIEEVPPGWVLRVDCGGTISVGGSTFEYVPGGVIITFVEGDGVECKFINSPAPPVGGVVMPTNNFAIMTPWLAVISLVGCIGTVVLVTKKRH